jgi:hypothetical protein
MRHLFTRPANPATAARILNCLNCDGYTNLQLGELRTALEAYPSNVRFTLQLQIAEVGGASSAGIFQHREERQGVVQVNATVPPKRNSNTLAGPSMGRTRSMGGQESYA